jgi:pyruvate dehydrogenase E1 component alpha subunit/2-oxoisovalerate dehydrogenase E1 component alpha subunit
MPKPPADALSRESLLELYHLLRLNRMVEERLATLYRQGKVIGGLYRSLGQEACSVGSAYALEKGDLFSPMIRNLGAILVRGGRPRDIFAQYMARATGPSRGRDLNVHFGWFSEEGSMLPTVSMLGNMIPIMVGALMAERMKGKPVVGLTWIGDGGASTGAFHEGLNLACVMRAPLVLIVENNKYAYSTPTRKQTANPRFAERAKAYGCNGAQVDGNDLLAVYEVTRRAIERARRGEGPTLIEADTMRMRGHAEHDDMRYVPKDLLEEWSRKDPLMRYERYLIARTIAGQSELDDIVLRIDKQLAEDVQWAEEQPLPDPESGLEGVFADRVVESAVPPLVRDWERRREKA